jgi:CRISPR-associated protein Csd1
MLLKRLVDYGRAHRGGTPAFYASREFNWSLDIRTADGVVTDVSLIPMTDPERPKRGVRHIVPSVGRANGVSPCLCADDAQYVLGLGDETTKPERVSVCHVAYVDSTRDWADATSRVINPVPHILTDFYAQGGLDRLVVPPGIKAKEGVLTIIDGIPAHTTPTAAEFWYSMVVRDKGSGRIDVCLVCGETGPLVNTIPSKVSASLVPGASNAATLVSINERVFGHNLAAQLVNTPICVACAADMMAGLTGVLSSECAITFPGQATRVAWWTTDPEEGAPIDQILQSGPDQVKALIRSVRSGVPTSRRQQARVCWLAVGGNVSRVMVRDWIDMPLASIDNGVENLDNNIARWFEDHRVSPRYPHPRTLADGTEIKAGEEYHSIQSMVRCLGRWNDKTNRYALLGAKNADRPDTAAHDLMRCALLNVPLPTTLLAHLLHRITNDGRVDDARASLVRLALTRSPNYHKDNHMTAALNASSQSPAYLSGRLFALLQVIQYAAHRKNEPNTTYTDRYFRSAVAAPRPALVQGCVEASAWLGKIRRKQPALADNFLRLMVEIHQPLTEEAGGGIPLRCGLDQQASFIMGYYHQWAHGYDPTKTSAAQETE